MLNPFKKPEAVARHLKIAVTGKSGVGKTCFGLDAKNHEMGPVAVLSNEAGDVHYIAHPRWGGFDRLATQSIAQFEQAVEYLEQNPGAYKTLVIDTITGLYEELVDAKSKDDGSVSMKDWGLIKRKWKSIVARLNNLPINIVAVVHENDITEAGKDGQNKVVGQKLDAEKTFERNPDVLLRLGVHDGKRVARVLKDRTSTYPTGHVVEDPTIGLWVKAIRSGGAEARVSPPEEVAKENEAAMNGAASPHAAEKETGQGQSTPPATAEPTASPDSTLTRDLQASVEAGPPTAAGLIAICNAGFDNEFHWKNWGKKWAKAIAALPDGEREAIRAAYKNAVPKAHSNGGAHAG